MILKDGNEAGRNGKGIVDLRGNSGALRLKLGRDGEGFNGVAAADR